jgi:capsular polysaccharide biosynthesis protein
MDRRVVLAIGVAIAAEIALGVAFQLDFFKAAVSTPEEAKRVLGVPVLASLPADWDRRATSV